MTLFEALKSGKRFRRKPGKCQHTSLNDLCNCGEWYEYRHDPSWRYCFKGTDVLADDWETEEQEVKIISGYDIGIDSWVIQVVVPVSAMDFRRQQETIKQLKEALLEETETLLEALGQGKP